MCLGNTEGLAASRCRLTRSPVLWYAKLIISGAARDQTPPPCRHAAWISAVTYQSGNGCCLLLCDFVPPVPRLISQTPPNSSTAGYVMLSRHACRCRGPNATSCAGSSSSLNRDEKASRRDKSGPLRAGRQHAGTRLRPVLLKPPAPSVVTRHH